MTTEIEDLTSFREAVASRVSSCNDLVRDRVVDIFVNEEVERRTPLIMSGLRKEEELEKTLKGLKPENTYDDNGNVLGSYWSHSTNQTKIKTKEALAKLRKALNDALNESNYEPLKKLVDKS